MLSIVYLFIYQKNGVNEFTPFRLVGTVDWDYPFIGPVLPISCPSSVVTNTASNASK